MWGNEIENMQLFSDQVVAQHSNSALKKSIKQYNKNKKMYGIIKTRIQGGYGHGN